MRFTIIKVTIYLLYIIYNIYLLKIHPFKSNPSMFYDRCYIPFPSHQFMDSGWGFGACPALATLGSTPATSSSQRSASESAGSGTPFADALGTVFLFMETTCEKSQWKWSWGIFFWIPGVVFFSCFCLFLFFSRGPKKTTQCKVLQGHTGKKHMWPGNCECHTVVIVMSSNPPGCKPWGLSDFPGHISSSKWILQRFRVSIESLPTWAWQSHPTVVLLWVRAAGFVSAKGQKIQLRPTDPVWHRCRKKMQMKFLEDGVWGHLKCLWLYTKSGGKEVYQLLCSVPLEGDRFMMLINYVYYNFTL